MKIHLLDAGRNVLPGNLSSVNAALFRDAWDMTRSISYRDAGSAMEFDRAVYETLPFEGALRGDAPIIGNGAHFLLVADCNSPLWQFGLKETWVEGITLDGNAERNKIPANRALWMLRNSYNVCLRECHVIRTTGDGLRLSGCGEVTLDRVQGDTLTGFAITLDDCLHASVRDCTGESCGGTLRIIGSKRSHVAGINVDGLYGEASGCCLLLENAQNVSARNIVATGGELFRMRGGSRGNVVDVTHTRGRGHIEAGCMGNTVYYNQGETFVYDEDGRNLLVPMANRWAIVGPPDPLLPHGDIVASLADVPRRFAGDGSATLRDIQCEAGEYLVYAAMRATGTPSGGLQVMDVDSHEMYLHAARQWVDSRGESLNLPLETRGNHYAVPIRLDKPRKVAATMFVFDKGRTGSQSRLDFLQIQRVREKENFNA